MPLRVLTVYHAGRDPEHRKRERALTDAGVDVTLVVPQEWPEASSESHLSAEPFAVVELPIRRSGDVNRHTYRDASKLRQLVDQVQPDLVDIREEPYSLAARQWLAACDPTMPIVMYTAQNIDKRLPPPFSAYEQAALRRAAGFCPCSRQAASVMRGKGFDGVITIVPLGFDDSVFFAGEQSLGSDEVTLMLTGRLVPEKGIEDAVRVMERVNSARPARLVVVGDGPMAARARTLAASLGVGERLEFVPWQPSAELAVRYRAAHLVLVPSRATYTWVEQFGRVIVEAQASGAVVAGYASGAIPEVAGDAGIIVPCGDVEQLARRVVAVLADGTDFAGRRELGRRQTQAGGWAAVAEQALSLFEAARTKDRSRVPLPRSPRRRRAQAREEFGPTAAARGGLRPFALPLLRNGGPLPRAIAWLIDRAGETMAWLPR